MKLWTKVFNESQKRIANIRLIPFLVSLKPFSIVVALELFEKLEELRSEVRFACHCDLAINLCFELAQLVLLNPQAIVMLPCANQTRQECVLV
jgi:hypothetical protein